MRYASRLAGNADTVYRQIDIAGRTTQADPQALVQLLYEELVSALRSCAWAVQHQQYKIRGEKVTRAIAILFALDAGLDFERGGDVSKTLGRLYSGARKTLVDASIGQDPAPFLHVAETLEDIGKAWASARASLGQG
jgi:flagellar protein FliS